MPWQFEQTGKKDGMILGRQWCDFRWNEVQVPVQQPRPQHKRGLTLVQDARAVHQSPSRTRDGTSVCPEFLRFRKRLSFPASA